MNLLSLQLASFNAAISTVEFAANWLLQSSLLLCAGLTVARLLRQKGSAVESIIYRTTIVAVLLCPLATWCFSLAGISGWSVKLSKGSNRQPADGELVEAALPNPIVNEEGRDFNRSPIPQAPEFHTDKVESTGEVRILNNASRHLSGEVEHAATPTIGVRPVAARSQVSPESPLRASVLGGVALSLAASWLLVSFSLLARLVIAWQRLAGLRRRAVEADSRTIQACRELASSLAVPMPRVLRNPCLPSPCLAGLLRPMVLLPGDDQDLSIREVLIHELAHLRRRDCHWNLLRQIATAVFFFQPLLWRLSRRLEATAEEVCDDYVVEFGGNREEYANGLVAIAELSAAPIAPAGVGIVSFRSMLARRVNRIMDRSRALSTRVGNLLLAVVLVCGVIGTVTTGLVGLAPRSTRANVAVSSTAESPAESDNDNSAAGLQNDEAGPADEEGTTEESARSQPTSSDVTSNDAIESKQQPAKEDDSEIFGKVLGADGKAVAGAKFYWLRTRVHDLDPMKPQLIATSDESGSYRFTVPPLGIAPDAPASWAYLQWMVVRASGHGFSIQRPSQLRRQMKESAGILGSLASAVTGRKGVTIKLPPRGNSVRGRLVDIDGQPVAGAIIRTRWFTEGDSHRFSRRDANARDPEHAEWRARVSNLLMIIEPARLREVLPMAQTDADGHFELQDIGPKRMLQLLVEGEDVESTEILARNEEGAVVEVPPDRHSAGAARKVYPRELLQVLARSKPVEGRVVDVETGKPIAGAIVRAYQIHGKRLNSSREREHFSTRTDADGRYRITGLPVGDGNRLVALTAGDIPYIPAGRQADSSGGGTVLSQQDFRLRRGVWAEGRVYDQESGKPFTGEITYYYFSNEDIDKRFPGLRRAYLDGRYWTNTDGEFRVPVLPARGILAYRYSGSSFDRDGIDNYPRGYGADAIEGQADRGGLNSFATRPHYLIPSNFQRLLEVLPEDGQDLVRADMPLAASQTVTIRVVDRASKPVINSQAYGAARNWGWQRFPTADIVVQGLKPTERRKVFIYHRQRDLAGAMTVDGTEGEVIQVKLERAGSVVGRLVDSNGEPITDASLDADYERLGEDNGVAIWAPHPELSANPTTIPVDREGRFRLDGLVAGRTYNARASAPRKVRGQLMNYGIGKVFTDVTVEPGQERDLGDLVVGAAAP